MVVMRPGFVVSGGQSLHTGGHWWSGAWDCWSLVVRRLELVVTGGQELGIGGHWWSKH